MIIKRDKTYSTKGLRAIKIAKTVGNRIMTKVDNIGLSAGNKLLNQKGPSASFRFKNKTNMAINRESIGLRNKIKDKAINTVSTPVGKLADKGISYAVGHPIAATGQTAAVVVPVSAPVLAGVPFGSSSVALEGALKSKFKGYQKATEKLEAGYKKSKVSRALSKHRTPSLVELANKASSSHIPLVNI